MGLCILQGLTCFYILRNYNFVFVYMILMEMILVSVVFTTMLFMSICMMIRNKRFKALATTDRKYASAILLVGAFMIICDEVLYGRGGESLFFDMVLVSVTLTVLLMSVVSDRVKKVIVYVVVVLELILTSYYIVFGLTGLPSLLQSGWLAKSSAVLSLAGAAALMLGIYYRIRIVRMLLQSGSVWFWLRLSVDIFYCLSLISLSMISLVLSSSSLLCWVIFIMVTLYMAACSWRIISDAQFALMQRHERRIVESMKLLPVETVGVTSKDDDVYKELFDRIQRFFEEEKPYLKGSLTINDVVAEVFSNKVYISRAISQFTGRNFCQYVNYHRVMYIMDYYRAHPDLKVSDLWPICGFNTIVSFNMAFRLFVGENPSDWCRRERIRMSRKRK